MQLVEEDKRYAKDGGNDRGQDYFNAESSAESNTSTQGKTCHADKDEDENDNSIIITCSENSFQQHICEDNYQTNDIPLPPPPPEPKYSFHRRVLPDSLIQFSSPEGRKLFKESLAHGTSEAFFLLAEQFLNQSEPAYCGVTSLVMILNAIGIDPKVRWKGPWRWYDDEMILETCCIKAERVKRTGILMEEFQSLARCQGLTIDMKRPFVHGDDQKDDQSQCQEKKNEDDNDENNGPHGLNDFRNNIIQMVQNPPRYIDSHSQESESSAQKGGFMVVSFSRPSLGQTGSGHYSPIAAYHEDSDRCLVMDVARYKYAPYWVCVKDLYESTKPIDPMTGRSRGWFMMYPPPEVEGGGFKGTKTRDEAKRSVSEDRDYSCRMDECSRENKCVA